MKAPDLTVIDDAGVHPWNGGPKRSSPPRRTRTSASRPSTFAKAHDRAALFAELDKALRLPEHFGHNWDALADVLEDRDWLGPPRHRRRPVPCRRATARSSAPSGHARGHPRRAAEFWKERHAGFWVF
jgi:hypothetical protein